MKKSAAWIFAVFFLFCQVNLIHSQGAPSTDRKTFLIKNEISNTDKLRVLDNLLEAIEKMYFDSGFNGINLLKLREIYQPQIIAAKNKIELKNILNKMLAEFKTSHLIVSFEIGIRGKTLDSMFGKDADYKNNDINFSLGTTVKKIGGDLVVSEVFKNSSAEQSGIKAGWIQKNCEASPVIESVGNQSIFKEVLDCVFIDETQNERKIKTFSSWYLQPKAKTITNSKLLDNKTLYLRFTEFNKNTDDWLRREISQNPNAETIMIDLRGNFGGLLSALKNSLSLFFPSQTFIGTAITRELTEKTLLVGSANHYKGKVFVLIDSNSYSCAEIFASVIKESGRGKVIGETSSGQVLLSRRKSLSKDFRLQIAVWDYRDIEGNRLEGKGVIPDVAIPISKESFSLRNEEIYDEVLKLIKNF